MYEVPLDDLDRKLHRRIRMRLADSCAELNKSKEQTDLRSYFTKAATKILTKKEMKAVDNVNVKLYVGLSDEDKKILKKVLKSGGAEDDTDSMIIEI
ncbi:hypothetical protein G6F36_014030 [Rhizopus arrhizus]|nr:hypothetical protein G6F36_014030 [Rhizopus arrhizus]